MRHSIRTRLVVIFIGLAVGPLLLVGLILAWQSFTVQQQEAIALQHEIATPESSQVVAFVQALEDELQISVNSVHQAKTRITQALRDVVQHLRDSGDW